MAKPGSHQPPTSEYHQIISKKIYALSRCVPMAGAKITVQLWQLGKAS